MCTWSRYIMSPTTICTERQYVPSHDIVPDKIRYLKVGLEDALDVRLLLSANLSITVHFHFQFHVLFCLRNERCFVIGSNLMPVEPIK